MPTIIRNPPTRSITSIASTAPKPCRATAPKKSRTLLALLLLPLLTPACTYDPHAGHFVLNAQPAPPSSPLPDRLDYLNDVADYHRYHEGPPPQDPIPYPTDQPFRPQ